MVHISCFFFFFFPHAKQAVYYVLTRGGMTSGLGGYSFSPADYCCSVFLLIALILSHRQTFFFLKYIQNNAACFITSATGTVFLNGTAQQFLCLCLYIYVCFMNT